MTLTPPRPLLWSLLVLSALAHLWLSYTVERANFTVVISLIALLFGIYFWIIRTAHTEQDYKIAFGISIGIRAALLFSVPNLSDDFYRFIWDGRLLAHGESPFAKLPSVYSPNDLAAFGLDADLLSKLNSPNYFSVYPALCQLGFWLGASLSPSSVFGSVVVMKLYLFLFECGTLFLLPALCAAAGIDKKNTLVYALNPLVIIELCGNLHFEAVMIFFLVLTLYLLRSIDAAPTKNSWLAALTLSLSASAKLLPLMFLPLLTRRLGWRSGVWFSAATLSLTLLFLALVVPLSIVENFFSSVKLYFQTFEFNASLYTAARFVGNRFFEYAVVSKFGTALALVSALIIVVLALRRPALTMLQCAETMLFSLATYFVFATTVHPWYLTTLVALSAFSRYRFGIGWSGAAALSYAAYQSPPYQEQAWLTVIEYVVVFGVFVVERQQFRQAT